MKFNENINILNTKLKYYEYVSIYIQYAKSFQERVMLSLHICFCLSNFQLGSWQVVLEKVASGCELQKQCVCVCVCVKVGEDSSFISRSHVIYGLIDVYWPMEIHSCFNKLILETKVHGYDAGITTYIITLGYTISLGKETA